MVFLVAMLIMPVAAQIHIQPERGRYFGVGWCAEVDSYFRVAGSVRENDWHGSGCWVDMDWPDGVLKAVFTVKFGDIMEGTTPGGIRYIWFLYGEARVYVNGRYIGTYYSAMQLADSAYVNPSVLPGEQPDWVAFALYEKTEYWPLGPFIYDTEVNPRVTDGNIVTWFTV